MDDHLQTMNIEEQQTMAEPIERLEEIPLTAPDYIGPQESAPSPA